MVEVKDLIEQNPWWRNRNWAEYDKHLSALKRQPLQIKRKDIKKKNSVNIIYGPRQVGKTTFLKQKIMELVEKGISPEKIAYFSCDALLTNKRDELRQATLFFLERRPDYLLIDEISNIPDWAYEIKYFIDAGRFDGIVVFITGSPLGMKEFLPGRKLSYHYIMPLSFRDFLENLDKNLNEKTQKAFNLKKSEVEEIKTISGILPCYEFKELTELNDKIKKIESHLPILGKLFNAYIIAGGFPSVINNYIRYRLDGNKVNIMEDVKANKERLIDSLRKRGRNEGICFQLINSIKKRISSRYSFTELKETEIDLGKETIINYLDYLKSIFLVKIIYAYVFGREEVGWKMGKKIYLSDSFFYHEERILEEEKILSDDEYLGKVVESITAITLSYTKEDFITPLESFLWFWYGSKEIDFVYKEKDFFGIEVKYRRKAEKIHKISQIKKYIVLTKDVYDFRKDVIYVPAFLFLALVGKKESYL